ncbi:hypothetical protein M758_1G233400 [Ceratodon purpureus]|nr:hypothetical protein M758_1G233400 [Ceratodon purpureus]
MSGINGVHETNPAAQQFKKELENLVWLKRPVPANSVVAPAANSVTNVELCAAALEDWNKEVTILTARLDKKKTDVASVWNEIYQLIGFYSAFEGLLFTAVAQASTLTCKNWPFPLVLSLLATIFIIVGVIQKFGTIFYLKQNIAEKQRRRNTALKRLKKLRLAGNSFDFITEVDFKYRPTSVELKQRYLYILVAAILLFSATTCMGIWYILCDSGRKCT